MAGSKVKNDGHLLLHLDLFRRELDLGDTLTSGGEKRVNPEIPGRKQRAGPG